MPLLLAVLALLLLAAPASAQWVARPLPASAAADDPRLAFAGDGTALAAWRIFEPPAVRLEAARRPAGGAWGRACPLSRSQDLLLGPAAYGRTRLLHGFLETRGRHRLTVAFGRSTACGRGRLRTLRRARRIASPALATNPRGDAALAWYEDRGTFDDRVLVAVRRPGGGFDRPLRLARDRVRQVTVAVGARGDVLVAWEARGQVRVRFRRAGGRRFKRPQTIHSASTLGARLSAAVAPTGRAYLGWTAQGRREGGDAGPVIVQATAKPAGQRRFRRAQRLERFEGRVLEEGALRLALDERGTATAAWTGSDGIRVVATGPDGRFGPPLTVAPGADLLLDDLAVSAAGAGVAVWHAGPEARGPLQAAYRPPGDDFGAAETLAAEGRGARAAFPPRSNAPAVVWVDAGGARFADRTAGAR